MAKLGLEQIGIGIGIGMGAAATRHKGTVQYSTVQYAVMKSHTPKQHYCLPYQPFNLISPSSISVPKEIRLPTIGRRSAQFPLPKPKPCPCSHSSPILKHGHLATIRLRHNPPTPLRHASAIRVFHLVILWLSRGLELRVIRTLGSQLFGINARTAHASARVSRSAPTPIRSTADSLHLFRLHPSLLSCVVTLSPWYRKWWTSLALFHIPTPIYSTTVSPRAPVLIVQRLLPKLHEKPVVWPMD